MAIGSSSSSSKSEIAMSVGLLVALLGLIWEFYSLLQYRPSATEGHRSAMTSDGHNNNNNQTLLQLQSLHSELKDTKEELLDTISTLASQTSSLAKELVLAKQQYQANLTGIQRQFDQRWSELETQMMQERRQRRNAVAESASSPSVTTTPAAAAQKPPQFAQEKEEAWWQVEHLPLLPWEEASITGTCNPPEGIPEYCCARSTTKGSGQPIKFKPNLCTTNVDKYLHVADKARSYLADHPVQPGTTPCDVCRIVELLQQQNWTRVVMTGDSMSRQTVGGFQCELFRRGYKLTVQRHDEFQDKHKRGMRYGFREKTTVTLQQTPGGEPILPRIRISFYIMYMPAEGSIRDWILQPPPLGADIYLFDHSLWYRHWEMERFRQDMTVYLQQLITTADANKPKMVVWREQSAQHFNRVGGSFSPRGLATVPQAGDDACVPIHNYTQKYEHWNVMWNITRQLDMEFVTPRMSAAAGNGLKHGNNNLYIIPFRDWTSQFWDIHRKGECTHYCSTPDLWHPIARALRIHMDSYVLGQQQEKRQDQHQQLSA